MSLEKQLSYRMFEQRELGSSHVGFEEEYALYHAVASGNIETAMEYAREYKKADAASNANNGILSKNPLQNTKYHFAWIIHGSINSHKIRRSYHYNQCRYLTLSEDSLKMGRLLLW